MELFLSDVSDTLTSKDRRVRKTRTAILRAFSRLALTQSYETIKVADIAEAADVGRSTFYEHFSGRDAAHLEALKGPLSIMAGAADEIPDVDLIARLIGHYWEYRALARNTFSGPQRVRVLALLTEMIEAKLPENAHNRRLIARQLAEGQAGLVRAWVSGELQASAQDLANTICDATRTSRNTSG
jgi:AcrR family transcriptional regulator